MSTAPAGPLALRGTSVPPTRHITTFEGKLRRPTSRQPTPSIVPLDTHAPFFLVCLPRLPSGKNTAPPEKMTQRNALLRVLCSVLLLATFAHGLRFELEARKAKDVRERCIRNFVGKDTLVVVTATISGNKGDGQQVNMQVGTAPPPLTRSFRSGGRHCMEFSRS